MGQADYFSKGEYLYLPSSKNPRVILNVSSSKIAQHSFKLYNPYSFKAKALKIVVQFLFTKVLGFAKNLPIVQRKEKTNFVSALEKELGCALHSSVYFATAADKVVIQLVAEEKIIGYLKQPLSELGIKRLLNEYRGIEILAKRKLVGSSKVFSSYAGKPYLVLDPIEGQIGWISKAQVKDVLQQFKKGQSHLLKNHPRVLQINKAIIQNKLKFLVPKMKEICQSSTNSYAEVYEHGDFAPWNLISTTSGIQAFDFEYFEELGLEHLDHIKYYYQIGKLLKSLTKQALLQFIQDNVQIMEFKEIMGVFLAKEIVRCQLDEENYDFELTLFNLL